MTAKPCFIGHVCGLSSAVILLRFRCDVCASLVPVTSMGVCVAEDMVRTNADETDGILVMTTKPLVINCSTSSDVPSDAVTW